MDGKNLAKELISLYVTKDCASAVGSSFSRLRAVRRVGSSPGARTGIELPTTRRAVRSDGPFRAGDPGPGTPVPLRAEMPASAAPIARSGDPGPTTRRLLVAVVLGVVAAVVTGLRAPWQTVPLVGWASTAVIWIVWTWVVVLRLDAADTAAMATREEPHRAMTDVSLITAAVASLVAVVLGVVKAAGVSGSTKVVLLGAGIGGVIASWGLVHTVFALRYAALYYTGPDGGIDFNGHDRPTYADFAYMAFTIGMTYQVSDTDLTARAIRHTALRHALLSYLFGTVIIAVTINIAAGLVK